MAAMRSALAHRACTSVPRSQVYKSLSWRCGCHSSRTMRWSVTAAARPAHCLLSSIRRRSRSAAVAASQVFWKGSRSWHCVVGIGEKGSSIIPAEHIIRPKRTPCERVSHCFSSSNAFGREQAKRSVKTRSRKTTVMYVAVVLLCQIRMGRHITRNPPVSDIVCSCACTRSKKQHDSRT